MKPKTYRPSIIGPLIIIAIGVLLLLSQMGTLSWSAIWSLLRFWPFILILFGVEILIGLTGSRAVYLVGVLAAIALLGSVIAYAVLRGEGAAPRPATDSETISHPMQDSDRGAIKLTFSAGTLKIGALTESREFVRGRIDYSRRSQRATQRFAVRDGRAEFSVEGHSQHLVWLDEQTGERWTFDFTTRTPLEMDIQFAVGSADLQLTELRVTRLNLHNAVGQVELTIPQNAGATIASVRLAVGEIIINVPEGVGARIHASRGLASVDVNSNRFVRSGDDWISRDYEKALNKVDLDVACALGTVRIR